MAKGEIKALYFSDGTSATAPFDMGSAFAGEKNYMYKGSSSASGWTASGAGVTVATSTDSTAVPRPNTTGSGIQITGVSGSTAYAYYRFIIDPADYSRKLKLVFDMAPVSGYASSDFKVDVYSFTNAGYSTGSTRLALSTDSSAISALPNLTGTFKTTFDAPTATSKWVEVRVGLNGTNTHSVIFSDFICGPGLVTQGAAVGPWTSYTLSITSSGSAPAKGTVSVDNAIYRRVGDCMEIKYTYRQTVAGTAGTGQYRFSLPSGFTVNNTVTPGSGNVPHVVGAATVSSGAANVDLVGIVSTPANTANGTYLEIFVGDETTNVSYVGAGVADLGNTNTSYSFSAVVPVNEWSGSGAINVLQNDIEYASNSGTWDASDTTSFQYGPAGQIMGGSLTGARTKRVRFPTPISANSFIRISVSENQVVWLEANGGTVNGNPIILTLDTTGAAALSSGITWKYVSGSATDIDVTFNKYQSIANDDSPVVNWPSSNGYWRAEKISGVQAVGFALADASNAGLVGTGTQTFAGPKTFSGLVTASASGGGIAIESARSAPAASDTQNVYSFSFTPSLSTPGGVLVTPITTTASTGIVMRVGSYAIVSMRIRPTTTGAGTFTFRIANPFSGAGNAGATADASGVFTATDGSRTQSMIVSAVVGQTYLSVQGICSAALSSDDFWGSFVMKVQ